MPLDHPTESVIFGVPLFHLEKLIMSKPLPEPTPARVLRARKQANLTQPEAAALVHLAHAIRWSEYERGKHQIALATWELFLYKTGQRELVLDEEAA
jgi:hypothetical protein